MKVCLQDWPNFHLMVIKNVQLTLAVNISKLKQLFASTARLVPNLQLIINVDIFKIIKNPVFGWIFGFVFLECLRLSL